MKRGIANSRRGLVESELICQDSWLQSSTDNPFRLSACPQIQKTLDEWWLVMRGTQK